MQEQQPNKNVFKGQIRKGNVFKRKMLPYTKTMRQRKIGVSIGIPPFKPRKAGFIGENGYTENKSSTRRNEKTFTEEEAERTFQKEGTRTYCVCDTYDEGGWPIIKVFFCDQKTPEDCEEGTRRVYNP
jgi:hypothetical protein